MSKAKKWNDPIHPGEILADELEYISMTAAMFAQEIGVSGKHISQIINAKLILLLILPNAWQVF